MKSGEIQREKMKQKPPVKKRRASTFIMKSGRRKFGMGFIAGGAGLQRFGEAFCMKSASA
ncbi:MAG: hypothetical protein SPI25_00320 [Dialister sp.]|nr:hypothetical protein [Dialister sp.]